jgi:pimeloyl-ACP methyl ester carboxylesterase
MDALSEEYRVYAFDLWGFGDSDKSNKDRFNVDAYVSLLDAFINELGVFGPVPLVGHALGAVVAVSFALQYPEVVDRVMAVSLPMDKSVINRRFLSSGGSLFDRVLGRSPTAGYEELEQEANRAAPDAIEVSVRSVMELDLRARLGSLNAPLLILCGENDSVITPSSETDLVGLDNSVRMLSVPEARHFPMLDKSSQFNRLLHDFLNAGEDLSELELKDEWQRRVR